MKCQNFFYSFKRVRCSYAITLAFVLLIMVPLTSCTEDEGPDCSDQGTNLSISEISGNWTASSAIFSRDVGGTIQQVDVVAEGGTVTLSIQSNGRFTLNVAESDGPNDVSSGDFCFDEELLVVRFDGDAPDDWDYFRVQLDSSNDILYISGRGEFDFDGNGMVELAEIDLELVRN